MEQIKRSTATVLVSIEVFHKGDMNIEEIVNEMDYNFLSGTHDAVVINNNSEIIATDAKAVNEEIENQESAQYIMETNETPVQSFHVYLSNLDDYEDSKDWDAAKRYDFFMDMQMRLQDGFNINTYQYNLPDFITEYLGDEA